MSLRDPKRFGGKTTLAVVIAGLSLGMTSPTLHAQQSDEALTLEVVRVVAQKREESVFEVPAAVTAISAEMLANSGINDFSGLTALAPSLTIKDAENTGNASINLRGIGTYAFSIGVEPSVSVIVETAVPKKSRIRPYIPSSSIFGCLVAPQPLCFVGSYECIALICADLFLWRTIPMLKKSDALQS